MGIFGVNMLLKVVSRDDLIVLHLSNGFKKRLAVGLVR